jgi:hypothetical protein
MYTVVFACLIECLVRTKAQHDQNKQPKNNFAEGPIDNLSSSVAVPVISGTEMKPSVHVSSSLSDQHPRPVEADRGTSSGIRSSSKKQKKRNRRNQDRSSSSVTLDFRSASRLAGGGENVTGETADKMTTSEQLTVSNLADCKVKNTTKCGTENGSPQSNLNSKTRKDSICKTSDGAAACADDCFKIPDDKQSGLRSCIF